jgi:serine/threonine-protein phosphatase 2B catalytic subunit
MLERSLGTNLVAFDVYSRRADITNERLPPELIDADADAPASPLRSGPGTPSEATPPMLSSPNESPALGSESPLGSPGSPGSPELGSPWKPGHGRRFSLGTTRGSPSNRRRSLDQTMQLMKEVLEGTDANGSDKAIERIADNLGSPTASPTRTKSIGGLA